MAPNTRIKNLRQIKRDFLHLESVSASTKYYQGSTIYSDLSYHVACGSEIKIDKPLVV